MRNKLKREKNKTMTEQVYEKLEHLIVFCEIKPGTVLSETEISEMIGAGRTPVREALRLLARESLVNISRIGVLIPEMSATIQLELLEVRRAILHLCVKSAIHRLTQLDKNAIQELLDSVDEKDEVAFYHWLKQRHKVLGKCSKNHFIHQELSNVQGLSNRFWYYYAKPENHEEGKILHKNILEAILKKDLQMACLRVDELMDYLEKFVRNNSI
ncbi:MAG: GntR family transcriptional regulator [Poseidonibacter sp.]